MKKYFFLGLALISLTAQAQKTKKAAPAAKKPFPTMAMKSLNDSVSYAVGVSVANFYAQQGVKSLNSDLVAKGITDVLQRQHTQLSDQQCQEVVMRFLNPKLTDNLDKGVAFLAENKKKAGVKTTASGLQYMVLTQGTGVRPGATDTVEVNYAGTLIDGREFDNSYKRGQSISFPLNGVIRGWTEGLQLMSVGSKYRFFIPQELGYGMNDRGEAIPGGSVLIFDVELLNVKKAQ